MMWGAHEGMGWWMLFSGMLWLLFIIAIVYVVAGLLRPERRSTEPADALEIARRRYASGEITRQEFEQIRDDLTSK